MSIKFSFRSGGQYCSEKNPTKKYNRTFNTNMYFLFTQINQYTLLINLTALLDLFIALISVGSLIIPILHNGYLTILLFFKPVFLIWAEANFIETSLVAAKARFNMSVQLEPSQFEQTI